MWLGGSVANVKPPQAVLPTKNLTPTLLPASPRPIFRHFCLDAIGVLWCYRAKERWTPMASYRAEWANVTDAVAGTKDGSLHKSRIDFCARVKTPFRR